MRIDTSQITPPQGDPVPVEEIEYLDCDLSAIVHPVAEGRCDETVG
nr:hypothetical protein [Haematobacter missouriensis]